MKKILLNSIVIIFLIMSLEVYGKSVVDVFFDTFQKKICTDSFCIKRPKGWIPYMVKRNDDLFVFDLIKSSWIPGELYSESNVKDFKEGVDLIKDNKIITVIPLSLKEEKFVNKKQHMILSERCYEVEYQNLYTVNCFDSNISIFLDKFDEKIIEEILGQ